MRLFEQKDSGARIRLQRCGFEPHDGHLCCSNIVMFLGESLRRASHQGFEASVLKGIAGRPSALYTLPSGVFIQS